MLKPMFLFAYALLSFSVLKSQTKIKKLDSLINELSVRKDFNGSVLIANEKGMFYKKNIGFQFKGNRENIRAMCIGSITKTFTAAAIAKLWEQDILKLDDPVTKYIPSFKNGDSITLRMLLNHTSGVKREIFDDLDERKKDHSSTELTDSIIKYQLDSKPGKNYSYSNAGYALLARIIEIITKKSYAQYLSENIFKPLQMNDTKVLMIASKKDKGFDPSGYPKGVEEAFPESGSSNFGAGNIYSTIDDLYKWNLAFTKKNRVLRSNTWDTILRKAYGFGRYKRLDKIAIGHDGIVNGFIANLDYFENEKTTITFLSSVRSGALGYLQDGLAQIYFYDKSPVVLPEFSKQLDKSALKIFVGSYELFPGFNLDIMLKNGQLYLRGKGGYFTYLDNVQSNTFFYRALYAFIEFKKEGDKYTLYWKDLSGSVYPGKKVL